MDIAALQKKKRELEARLAEMDEIKRDLEAIERVNRMLNGTQTAEVEESPAQESPDRGSSGYGEVFESVANIVETFSGPFTSTEVHEALLLKGLEFNRSSVAGGLGKLRDSGVITTIEEGRGRRPSKYVVTQKNFLTGSLERSGEE